MKGLLDERHCVQFSSRGKEHGIWWGMDEHKLGLIGSGMKEGKEDIATYMVVIKEDMGASDT